jgi:putative hydrolase of the HAD superfamily
MRPPTWLFDLDNTLHNASHAIFPAINVNMNLFIKRVLAERGLPSDDASVDALRYDYWQRYGVTLLGMMRHHQVNQTEFLHAAHSFDDLPAMVRAERGLLRLLRRLPGRKILLTNAPRRYANELMRELGLHRDFRQQISVEMMRVHGRLRPKPSRQFLRKLLAREGLRASGCVLVEDTLANLKAAKSVGLRTVWITQFLPAESQPAKNPAYVDVKVKSVRRLAGNLQRLSG